MNLAELRHHGDLTPPRPGDVIVAVSAGPSGEAIAIWSDAQGRARLHRQEHMLDGATVRIATYWPQLGPVVEVAGLDVAFPLPAPLPDGRVLIAGSRCQWFPDGAERNAVVFDDAGTQVADAVFGDGVEHVLTTPTGQVWVGYFDEGVFGNFGWGGPGPEPIGAGGIVRFGPDLSLRWSFPLDTSMADCYALNVTGETAWACYYTDFPVARIERDSISHWANNAATGVRALIVAGDRCALIGGYGADDRGRLVAGELDAGTFQALEHRTLVLPDEPVQFVARGNELNVFTSTGWYKLDERW